MYVDKKQQAVENYMEARKYAQIWYDFVAPYSTDCARQLWNMLEKEAFDDLIQIRYNEYN
jgi:hypothetical protein